MDRAIFSSAEDLYSRFEGRSGSGDMKMIDRRMIYHPLLGPVIASRGKNEADEKPLTFSPSHDAKTSKFKSSELSLSKNGAK